jgi:hypothetical protein
MSPTCTGCKSSVQQTEDGVQVCSNCIPFSLEQCLSCGCHFKNKQRVFLMHCKDPRGYASLSALAKACSSEEEEEETVKPICERFYIYQKDPWRIRARQRGNFFIWKNIRLGGIVETQEQARIEPACGNCALKHPLLSYWPSSADSETSYRSEASHLIKIIS